MGSRKHKGRRGASPGRSRPNQWFKAGLVVAGALAAIGATSWFLKNNPQPASTSAPQAAGKRAPGADDRRIFSAYAGSKSCRPCHQEAYDFWARSHHGLAERPLNPELDKAAFDPPRSFHHGTQTSEARFTNGQSQVVTKGFGGKREPYPVERVIGVSPLRQFLVPAPGGRRQTLEATYDPHRNEWFNVYGQEDRQPGEWGHWTGRGMNWNQMCASCHNTRLRKHYSEATDSYATSMAEMGVGCESCHGPMKDHADWQTARPDSKAADPTLRRFSKDQILDTCGSCHARRAELTGEFQPGDAFFDHYSLAIVDETDLFYADGQVREEDYEFTSFLSSRMHAAGVRCLDCHHPHSAKTILPGNNLCMRCHSGGYPNSPKIDPVTHSFHKPDNAGSQCVNCHMPQTVYMQRHRRHDHGFTIPDPQLTQQHGIPNACNRCHADKDTDWARRAVTNWYGPRMDRPSRRRTQWIAAARKGDATARDPLLEMLRGNETPYWKAVAVGLLDPWLAEPKVGAALVSSLTHTSALVRAQAARALAPLTEQRRADVRDALRVRLDDPARSVRVSAAWALRASIDFGSPAGQDLQQALDYNADQPAGQMQKGALQIARQNPAQALAHYQKAVEWDPNSAPSRHDLAVVLGMLNRSQEAVEQLQEACRLSPAEAEYQYKLGLAWNEAGATDKTARALEEAVRLEPRHTRAWYNLGLARNALGQSEEALAALVRAESIEPDDPRIPYARATVLARAGRTAEARAAASRALEIRSDFADARNLLRSLGP